MGLGPITYAMLRHAQCPVAVIPGSIVPWPAPEYVEIVRQAQVRLNRPPSCVAV